MQKSDVIYRQQVIDTISYSIELCNKALDSMTLVGKDRYAVEVERDSLLELKDDIEWLSPAQPEELTDDDFETIRIHLNAYKEKLCNQRRWKEAEEYQRIIDRFMTFASVESGRKKGKWIDDGKGLYMCSSCGKLWVHWWTRAVPPNQMCKELRYCPMCGADMRGDDSETD